jgi:hypothetical protein
MTIFTEDNISEEAERRGLKTGDRLWVAGDSVDGAAVHTGNGPDNSAVYLRFSDIGIRDPFFKKKGENTS